MSQQLSPRQDSLTSLNVGSRQAWRWTLVISLIIVTLIGLQTLKTFKILCFPQVLTRFLPADLIVGCDPALYPILEYPMYNTVFYEGATVPQRYIYGTTAEGTEVNITHEDLGINVFMLMDVFDDIIEDEDTERLAFYVRYYEETYGVDLTAVRLEIHPLAVQREGFEEQATVIVLETSVDAILAEEGGA